MLKKLSLDMNTYVKKTFSGHEYICKDTFSGHEYICKKKFSGHEYICKKNFLWRVAERLPVCRMQSA
jgi:hypothetical protein